MLGTTSSVLGGCARDCDVGDGTQAFYLQDTYSGPVNDLFDTTVVALF